MNQHIQVLSLIPVQILNKCALPTGASDAAEPLRALRQDTPLALIAEQRFSSYFSIELLRRIL